MEWGPVIVTGRPAARVPPEMPTTLRTEVAIAIRLSTNLSYMHMYELDTISFDRRGMEKADFGNTSPRDGRTAILTQVTCGRRTRDIHLTTENFHNMIHIVVAAAASRWWCRRRRREGCPSSRWLADSCHLSTQPVCVRARARTHRRPLGILGPRPRAPSKGSTRWATWTALLAQQ